MAAQTMSAPPSPQWRPPPWSIPSGRRLGFRTALIGWVPIWGLWMSISTTWTVAGSWQIWEQLWVFASTVIVLTGLGVIVAIGFGILMIVTASRPPLKSLSIYQGLTSTPTAARWVGVAFLFPQAIGWAIALVAHFIPIGPSPSTTSPPLAFDIKILSASLSPLFAMLCFLGCLLLARRAANRPIKQAIVSGLAPSYTMAPGLYYWWDGADWRSVADSAPEGALHSADGHYWWTGVYWVPMPSDRRSTKPLRASVA
jgi:hypothetical protein